MCFCTVAQPVVYFDNGAGDRLTGGGFNGPSQMQGWSFRAETDLLVTDLGLFDGRVSGGFLEPHTVGLWNSETQLLATAGFAVGDGAPLLGSFRYLPVAPLVLRAGRIYVIGVFLPAPVVDYTQVFHVSQVPSVNLTIDGRITFLQYRASPSDGLAFPSPSAGEFFGGFGPNLIVQASPSPTARALKLGVRDALRALQATRLHPSDRARIANALSLIEQSLAPALWVDDSHVRPGGDGQKVFKKEGQVVARIEQLIRKNHSHLDSGQLRPHIDALVEADHALASTAITDAIARGGNAASIQQAQALLAQGVEASAGSHPQTAIDWFRRAWASATGA